MPDSGAAKEEYLSGEGGLPTWEVEVVEVIWAETRLPSCGAEDWESGLGKRFVGEEEVGAGAGAVVVVGAVRVGLGDLSFET
jgi:hypothetical protein